MMLTLARKELRTLFAAPATWWLLALLQFIFGWFFLARVDDYLQVQAQLAQMDNAPGATIAIAAPLAGVLALVLMMLIPLFAMRAIAEERRNRSWLLLITSPLTARQIVLGKYLGLLTLLTLIIAACGLMLGLLAAGTRADLGLLAASLLGVWLLAAAYAALGLYCSALTRQPALAALAALLLSFGLWLADVGSPALRTLSPNAHFQNLQTGLIATPDLIYFLLFTAACLWLTIRRVRQDTGGGA